MSDVRFEKHVTKAVYLGSLMINHYTVMVMMRLIISITS